MKKITLLAALATLLFSTAWAAQPAFTGAPRSAKLWLNSDPMGLDQLKYLAGRSSVLDALDAVLAAAVIAETNRAQVAEGVLTAAVIAETNRAQVAEGALASALLPVTNALSLFVRGYLSSDGTNVFYISADFVYTNALTTNSP